MNRTDLTTAERLPDADWTHPLYEDLRLIARALMRRERVSHTLDPTALVHEVWLRLAAPGDDSEEGRRIALRRAVHWMRRILIDHARAKATARRGGLSGRRLGLDMDSIVARSSTFDAADLLTLDELMTRLEARYPRQAEALQLKVLGGFSSAEIARHAEVAERTVREHIAFAEAWLKREVGRDVPASRH